MRAGVAPAAALLLIIASLALQVSPAEDIYWEGEEDASNEFLEVKETDPGILGHLQRIKRDFWSFLTPTVTSAPEAEMEETTDDRVDDETAEEDDKLDNDGSGVRLRAEPENKPEQEKTLRVTFLVMQPYHPNYSNRDSIQFQNFSKSLAEEVNKVYEKLPGTQRATLVRIQSQVPDDFMCKVTFDIVTTGFYDIERIKDTLRNHIRNTRNLGGVAVNDTDFSSMVVDPATIDECNEGEIRCEDGKCLSAAARCNGISDCYDSSDEALCPTTTPSSVESCPPENLQCDDGSCVSGTLCDGNNDCPDGSDEVTCSTDDNFWSGQSQETSGTTPRLWNSVEQRGYDISNKEETYNHIPIEAPNRYANCSDPQPCKNSFTIQVCPSQLCDGKADCPEGDDESNCYTTEATKECTSTELRCDDMRCVPADKRCDGYRDCSDGKDEENCPETTEYCGADDFRCNDGKCIESRRRCDSITDCADEEDEQNCECREDEFKCKSDGSCIEKWKRCDGINNCRDSSDEQECVSRIFDWTGHHVCKDRGRFRCRNGSCISILLRCDGIRDCISDGSDELGCPCSSNQWQCDFGNCIERSKRCDGRVDCPTDRSDERNCFAAGFFRCSSGKLIPEYLRCDRRYDCPPGDYSDEQNCPCGDKDFKCDNGHCIPASKHCDMTHDCQDASDERDCTYGTQCMAYEYKCSSGQCVHAESWCNGTFECNDLSDEMNCTCKRGQFDCRDGTCISLGQRCNGYNDCLSGSDELGCEAKSCPPGAFTCYPSSSLPCATRCDGYKECDDGEDEEDCDGAPDCEHECDGKCLDARQVCDQFKDCSDGSDEANCYNCDGRDDFRCNNGECIHRNQYCNGEADCEDESDESECGAITSKPETCNENQFTCKDESCINSHFVCDGRDDCLDGSDELNCGCPNSNYQCQSGRCADRWEDCEENRMLTTTNAPFYRPRPTYAQVTLPPVIQTTSSLLLEGCGKNQWRCENGPCIALYRRCDGRVDCPFDTSDELDCPRGSPVPLKLNIYDSDQVVRHGGDVVFRCRDEGPLHARVKWVREGGRPLKQGSTDVRGRLEMNNVTLSDSGVYICKATDYPALTNSELRVTLTVEPSSASPPRGLPATPRCDPYTESTCHSGHCIAKSLVCNGQKDCADGSDEDNCGYGGFCEPNHFKCKNGRCVLKSWVCDGENDCRDGSDEEECGVSQPGELCLPSEFTCESKNQCIPKSYRCDGQSDCLDFTDEIGCAPVHITKPPQPSNIKLKPGDTLILTCSAVGVPTPLITWRLNWGKVPSQCTQQNQDGTGKLVCTNMQPTDSGAYSCEALNNKGTNFATPDSIVFVEKTDVCPNGYFNSEARYENECIKCFCFGESTQCKSADLFTYNMPTPLGEGGTRLVGIQTAYNGDVVLNVTQPITEQYYYTPQRNAATVTKLARTRTTNAHPYLALPETYNGNQLTSYGGHIKYRVTPHSRRFDYQTVPDIIIKGKYQSLVHLNNRDKTRDTLVEARLTPENWKKSGPRGLEAVTREDVMMALDQVEMILLRADLNDAGVDISEFVMESAHNINTGLGAASLVEECTCPPGYEGLSCQKCAPGYVRERAGPWLGHCVPVDQPCMPGQYRAPGTGACLPCPCPLTNRENQFARTCNIGYDGDVICDCAPGYEGRKCERCSSGYVGNPMVPGDSCRIPPPKTCNPIGTRYIPLPGECVCKDNVQGQYCDQCQNKTFFLSEDFKYGCAMCFCSGMTEDCTSSNWRRKTVVAHFDNPSIISQVEIFKSTSDDSKYKVPIKTPLQPDLSDGRMVARNLDWSEDSIFYWSLPPSFVGNLLTSYGGYLTYSLRHSYALGSNSAPEVQLITVNGPTYHYYGTAERNSDYYSNTSIQIIEKGWQRPDGEEVSREIFLLALADIESILIKATHSLRTDLSSLVSVSLEKAGPDGNGAMALHVEQCSCPAGHQGTSCETCSPGYTRGASGIYLRLCEPCNCNGHSSMCHPETGVCSNCRDNTQGNNCEQCTNGYEKDVYGICVPSGGRQPDDCNCDERGIARPCTSGICECKSNVEGAYCDRCRTGTFGLDANIPDGCLPCFCNGVSTECNEGNNYYKIQIPAPIFGGDYGGYSIMDLDAADVYNDNFVPVTNESELMYIFNSPPTNQMYWSLPVLPGNRVLSYGGFLSFKQKFDAGGYPTESTPGVDVVLVGEHTSVYWTSPEPIRSGETKSYQVPLKESEWRILNALGEVSRHDFMSVLSNLKRILVRATLSEYITSTAIADVLMDTATTVASFGAPIARKIEVCTCPAGHSGSSCDSCEPGYYKDVQGYCSPCNCNGHECSLSPYFDVICNCAPPYTGRDCSIVGGNPNTYETTPPPSPPAVIVRITSPTIKIQAVGTSVKFTCEAMSRFSRNRLPVQWSKVDGYLPQGRTQIDQESGLLLITNLQISDSGKYICQTSDGINTAQAVASLTVNNTGNDISRPTVSITPPIKEYYEGDRVELRCASSGNPAPSISWQRTSSRPLPLTAQFSGPYLIIDNAQVEDSGEYRCVASNTAGSTAGVAVVTIRQKPSPPRGKLTVSPTAANVVSGQSTHIVCTGTANIAPGSIGWIRQDGDLLSYNVRSHNGVLYIDEARPENQGVYICQTTYGAPSVPVLVTVEEISTSPPGEAPSVTVSVHPLRIASGQSGQVECTPHGYPLPAIRWRKHEGEFGPGTTQRDNTLIITNAQESDKGYYRCEGTVNETPVANVYVFVDIEKREMPQVEIWPREEQNAPLGGQFEFQCRVMAGIPEPVMMWSRDKGLPLSRHTQILPNNILRFENIDVNDEGVYTCSATNDVGTSNANALLKVRSPPEIIIRDGNYIKALRGSPLNVECRASGYPEPLVSIKSKSEYRDLVPPTPGVAVLRISSVTDNDAGEYTCLANSSAGHIEDQFLITVDRGDADFSDNGSGEEEFYPPPPNSDWQPKNLIAIEGTDARITCNGSGYYDVTWSRANRQQLQNNARQLGNELVIYRASKNDAGQYECTLVDRSTGAVQSAIYTTLVVMAAPRITLLPVTQTVHPGQSPTVECIVEGDDILEISWKPVNRALSNRVETRQSLLIFHQIEVEDAGKYECFARNRITNATAIAEVMVNDLERTPAESHDNEQWAHVGAAVHLSCNVSREQRIRWTKDGHSLPRSIRLKSDGSLFIRLAQKSDSGKYVCLIQDSYGRSTTNYINLHIEGLESSLECLATDFRCHDGTGCVSEELICDNYSDCDDSSDEENCQLRDKRLSKTFSNSFTTPDGPRDDTSLVSIDQPRHKFRAGENVEVLCRARTGVTAVWERYGTREYVQSTTYGDGSQLIVQGVQESDAGTYRCTGTDQYGRVSYEDFQLEVLPGSSSPSFPHSDKIVQYDAHLMDTVDLPCNHDLEPPVSFEWKKEYSQLSPSVRSNENVIHLEGVTEADAGTYICRVSNSRAAVEARAVLRVNGVVPRFDGEGWLALPALSDAYTQFHIEISFKPEDRDGLILYNSQEDGRNGDYIALQLIDGVPEFVIETGTGPITVKGDRPLQLNSWHTIRINRNKSRVTMDVDNTGPFIAESSGQYEILDLYQPLYIGKVPDTNKLPQALAGASGFIGCVSMLILHRKEKNIMIDSTDKYNVQACDSCRPNLCLNKGVCQEARNERGYMCLCAAGFAGLNCDRIGEACRPGLCGPGKCSDTTDGYKCSCPVTYIGKHCDVQQSIEYPAFTGSAYLAIRAPETSRSFRMSMKIKPTAPLTDGIVMYCAESPYGHGGFTSLALRNGRLEFRYDVDDGTGPVVLTSNLNLQPNEWTNVNIARIGAVVSLQANIIYSVEGKLRSPQKNLKLETPMFVGGVDDSIVLNNYTGVSGGFYGCIKDVKVYDDHVDIVNSSIQSANVSECSNSGADRGDIPESEGISVCSQCRNGGYCRTREATVCTCPAGYTGQFCENLATRNRPSMSPCASSPCLNGGTCEPNDPWTGYSCNCVVGIVGENCDTPLLQSAGFSGNGYLELPASLMRYDKLYEDPAVIAMAVHTHGDGVLLYQTESAEYGTGDFILLRVENGVVVLEFNMGDGVKTLAIDNVPVNDGERHKVIAKIDRDGQFSLSVDDTLRSAVTNGFSMTLNVDSNIYIGGIPEARNLNRYPGLTGCFEQVEFMGAGRGLNLGREAVSQRNVHQCIDERSGGSY